MTARKTAIVPAPPEVLAAKDKLLEGLDELRKLVGHRAALTDLWILLQTHILLLSPEDAEAVKAATESPAVLAHVAHLVAVANGNRETIRAAQTSGVKA